MHLIKCISYTYISVASPFEFAMKSHYQCLDLDGISSQTYTTAIKNNLFANEYFKWIKLFWFFNFWYCWQPGFLSDKAFQINLSDFWNNHVVMHAKDAFENCKKLIKNIKVHYAVVYCTKNHQTETSFFLKWQTQVLFQYQMISFA